MLFMQTIVASSALFERHVQRCPMAKHHLSRRYLNFHDGPSIPHFRSKFFHSFLSSLHFLRPTLQIFKPAFQLVFLSDLIHIIFITIFLILNKP